MDTFAFSNISTGNISLYIAPDDHGWCAYVLATGVSSSKTSLTLQETILLRGFYLFADHPPTIAADILVKHVWDYMATITKPVPPTNAILWLTAPDQVLTANNTPGLFLLLQGKEISVLKELNYNFGNNYATLFINNQNTIITIESDRFLLKGPMQAKTIRLTAVTISSSTQVQEFPLEIPFAGRGRGCLRFIIGLDHATDLKAFDVSVKYFYTASALVTINYPVFNNGSLNELILFQASIYPPDMLNADKAYLALTGETKNTGTHTTIPTLLSSGYKTDFAYPISLKPVVNFTTGNYPLPGSAMLIFSKRNDTDTAKWYAVPSGDYTLVISDTYIPYLDGNKQVRMMAGLSGTESISFTPQVKNTTGDILSFIPGQDAYAERFPVEGSANLNDNGEPRQLLNKKYYTAWVSFRSGSAGNAKIIYHAQPQGAAIFSPDQDVFSNQLLGYFTACAGMIAGIAFPLASYPAAGSTDIKTDLRQYEMQVLSPSRKTIIGSNYQTQLQQANKCLNDDELIKGTTPQGFYLEMQGNCGIWQLIQLASNQYLQSPVYKLAFRNPGHVLQNTFQSNQLFCVISNNRITEGIPVLGNFENTMYMDDWPFIIDVPKDNTYGQFNNVLIFKFHSGALINMVSNPQSWNMAEQFNYTENNGLGMLSTWMQEYMQTGIDKYIKNKDNDYYKFYTAVTDPNWQGVLVLGIKVDVQHFPPALQGLLAGIDLQRFNAHHFGIDMSIIQQDKGVLSMLPVSSLFGLIDYEDKVFEALGSDIDTYKKDAPINDEVDYDFKVLNMRILFKNAKISNFSSNIAIVINRLFEEKVLADNRENLLILKGSYENHNGVPTYNFNTAGNNILYLNSKIIQAAEIQKASFYTVIPQGNGDGVVQSVFSFWGFLNFNALSNFDIFSFGNEINTTPANTGLAFSSLILQMAFPLETPANRTFTFNIGSISFDIGQSSTRADSLYRHFPLQLTGMTQGNKENSPASQGYLNVTQWPQQPQEAISGNWYGLTFTLNMGTPGALASAAGFNTTFLAAWNTGGTGSAAGLKLPGVNPKAPFFSLQGILKLDVGAVSLSLADGSMPGHMAYLMRINNIAMKLLGLSFPSGGNIGFFLFGNPDQDAPPQSLGWYAAYVKK
jgi:hypothetical protein